jgi:hypothetical protein
MAGMIIVDARRVYNASMGGVVDHLWAVTRQVPHVDAASLAAALEAAASGDDPMDYRTRLLIRDSLRALAAHWGNERLQAWLRASPTRARIQQACDPKFLDPDPDEIGFPSLERRIVDAVRPETVERFFRELSLHVSRPTRLVVGGSIPLILAGQLTRSTEDVDVVDEVPAEIRTQYKVLDELADLYKLRLAHFQSHYLPDRWEKRIRSFGGFGNLHVFLVDPYDIFVGKLFSARLKDRADTNALASNLDRETIVRRLRESTAGLRSDARLLDAAAKNWFVLFGEPLPASV